VNAVGSFRYPVEEIREKSDLVEIVSAHVALRKRGKNLVGLCPFHNEKTPSFHVDPAKQLWHCYGCGEGGDVFSFVEKIDGVSFREALELLAQKAGVRVPGPERMARELSEREKLLHANSVACAFYRSRLRESARAMEYLAKRGLTESAIEKYRLGYAPDAWDELAKHLAGQRVAASDAVKAGLIVPRENSQGFYDRFRDRLMFPILDSSERVIAFGGRTLGDDVAKYLNSPETPLFAKSRTLFGLNYARRAIADANRVIVVEGYMDAISAQEAGFQNTVATLGTALTEEHVRIINRFTRNVVLAFDADSAGVSAALRSSSIFEREGLNVRILVMPRGEDPDSLLRSGDRTRFANMIEKAIGVPDYKVRLALQKHDLKTEEGKTAALKDAVKVLAEVVDSVDRERLIAQLARFHPTFGTASAPTEQLLRQEADRIRSRISRTAQHTDVPNVEKAGSRPRFGLIEKAERLLLGMIIGQKSDIDKVFAELPAKEYKGEDTRRLAEALSKQFDELGKIELERLRLEVAGSPAEKLLTELLLSEGEPDGPVDVREVIQTILLHHKNERRYRMRALAEKLQAGLLKQGDEEFEEYWRLVRETKGSSAPRVMK